MLLLVKCLETQITKNSWNTFSGYGILICQGEGMSLHVCLKKDSWMLRVTRLVEFFFLFSFFCLSFPISVIEAKFYAGTVFSWHRLACLSFQSFPFFEHLGSVKCTNYDIFIGKMYKCEELVTEVFLFCFQMLGRPAAVPLSNSLYLADRHRIASTIKYQREHGNNDPCPFRFGKVIGLRLI